MSNFEKESRARLVVNAADIGLRKANSVFMRESIRAQYSYNFLALGRPIIQYPQDMVAVQELVWKARPDLIIETGIAHGGSLILSASMLALLDYCDAVEAGETLDPRKTHRRVLGIDIDIRAHNRAAIETHPLASAITLIEGSSIAPETVARVKSLTQPDETVMVILDSNHAKQHVLGELRAYSPLVTKGSYIVATDGIMKDLAGAPRSNVDWAENNPFMAVQEFLPAHPEFQQAQPKWLFNESNGLHQNTTYWPGAYLKRI